MGAVKLSVSVPETDVQFIDSYASSHGVESRSGVVQRALTLLRAEDLEADYAAAFVEWEDSGEDDLWETVVGDGLQPKDA